MVFDYYAKDKSHANIRVVNQTLQNRSGLRVRVRVYNLDGTSVFDRRATVDVSAQGVAQALVLPVLTNVTPVYFVRCELFDGDGARIVDNVYWQSVNPDDVGPRPNDSAFALKEVHLADFKPLQAMAKVHLDVKRKPVQRVRRRTMKFVVSLHNSSKQLAFFVRAEITGGKDGNEVLPVTGATMKSITADRLSR